MENILVLLTLSYFCSYLSSCLLLPLNTFPSHPLCWFLCCCRLDCFCVLCFCFFFCWFSLFFCLCLLFCFEIMTTNAVFPAILGFLKGCYCLWYKKVLPAIREMFWSVFPPEPFFQKHSWFVFIFCLFLFLLSSLSRFHVSVLFCINPFWDHILALFLLLYLFFCFIFVTTFFSLFVLLSFQQVSWHALLESNLISFLVVWLFYSLCLNDIVFRFGVSFFVFLVDFWFLLFLLGFCCVCCFGFRLWHRRKVFSLQSWCFWGG